MCNGFQYCNTLEFAGFSKNSFSELSVVEVLLYTSYHYSAVVNLASSMVFA